MMIFYFFALIIPQLSLLPKLCIYIYYSWLGRESLYCSWFDWMKMMIFYFFSLVISQLLLFPIFVYIQIWNCLWHDLLFVHSWLGRESLCYYWLLQWKWWSFTFFSSLVIHQLSLFSQALSKFKLFMIGSSVFFTLDQEDKIHATIDLLEWKWWKDIYPSLYCDENCRYYSCQFNVSFRGEIFLLPLRIFALLRQ